LMDNAGKTDAASPGLQGRKAGHFLILVVLAGGMNSLEISAKSCSGAL
jgi:hypothetical protein